MVNLRLRQQELPGQAIQGSILSPPFASDSFDVIVAIGCLHHTGNLREAIAQCLHILRPNGKLIMMVYYAYSYRRWFQAPMDTIRYAISEAKGNRDVIGTLLSRHRAAYDTNSAGKCAPHTDWISKKSLARFCDGFSSFRSKLENINSDPPFQHWSRTQLLKTRIPQLVGLDLYAIATK